TASLLYSHTHTPPTDTYTLSLHDALPIFLMNLGTPTSALEPACEGPDQRPHQHSDGTQQRERDDNCRGVAQAAAVIIALALLCRSEEHTSELQSPCNLVCRLLLAKQKTTP